MHLEQDGVTPEQLQGLHSLGAEGDHGVVIVDCLQCSTNSQQVGKGCLEDHSSRPR